MKSFFELFFSLLLLPRFFSSLIYLFLCSGHKLCLLHYFFFLSRFPCHSRDSNLAPSHTCDYVSSALQYCYAVGLTTEFLLHIFVKLIPNFRGNYNFAHAYRWSGSVRVNSEFFLETLNGVKQRKKCINSKNSNISSWRLL